MISFSDFIELLLFYMIYVSTWCENNSVIDKLIMSPSLNKITNKQHISKPIQYSGTLNNHVVVLIKV